MNTHSFGYEFFLIGFALISDHLDKLSSHELELIADSTPRRKLEFSTSRQLAKRLLTSLEVESKGILKNEFGAPIWPSGVTGSISHSGDWCFVAVGKSEDQAIGIDIQKVINISPDFSNLVLTKKERLYYSSLCLYDINCITNMVFSIKESIYKSLAYDKNITLDFQDIETRLKGIKFTAKIKKLNIDLEGLCKLFQGHVFSGLTKNKLTTEI